MDAYVRPYREIEAEEPAPGVLLRWVIDKRAGAKNYIMRVFEMSPGSTIKEHHHPREHEIFILEGSGKIKIGDKRYEVKKDYVVFIPEDVPHAYEAGPEGMKFICVIPCKGAPDRCV